MTKITIGLDLGIASCGWAVVASDDSKIIDAGVRCFTKAEHPKTGASLALPRRMKRGLRRVIARRGSRVRAIWALCCRSGLTSNGSRLEIIRRIDPWGTRAKALHEKLTGEELARVLLHVGKRRGFRSNKKGESSTTQDEEGKLLAGVQALTATFESVRADTTSGPKTIGAYLAGLPRKRNKNGEYALTVKRDLLESEVREIFKAQQQLNNAICTPRLLEEYCRIAFTQRPLQSTEKMVGVCQFEIDPPEKRAPLSSYSFEYARLLQTLNHAVIIKEDGTEERIVEPNLRQRIISKVHDVKAGVKYSNIRRILGLADGDRFKDLRYPRVDEDGKNPESTVFAKMPGFHKIREVYVDNGLEAEWNECKKDRALLNEIAWILTVEKDEGVTEKRLAKLPLSPREIGALKTLSFAKHGGLSIKALEKLIPFLEEGSTYYDATTKAGYSSDKRGRFERTTKLPPLDVDITNPVVMRALVQARKVVNALIQKYGIPERFHIELARDMSRSFEERRERKKENDKQRDYKESLQTSFKELYQREPKADEFTRFRLWKEQSHGCPYSLTNIPVEAVIDGTRTQIDHIIPFSRSFDDSWGNKVLVFIEENQKKGNRTPYEYLSTTRPDSWDRFLETVGRYDQPKYRRLTLRKFDDERERVWKERHLNDTRYITKTFASFVENRLAFDDINARHVFHRNGSITAMLRHTWGLKKDREESDRHHAQDAIVLAFSSERAVQTLTAWAQARERGIHIGKDKMERRLPPPFEGFRDTVEHFLAGVFISRMPQRTVTGAAHEETVRSLRKRRDGSTVVVQRIPLKKVTLKDLENLWDRARNKAVHEVLHKRLVDSDGDPERAFAPDRPVFMPCGEHVAEPPQIKSILVETSEKSGVQVAGRGAKGVGFASNGDQVRVDIFEKQGQYFAVPLYVSDFAKGELPAKAIASGKGEDDWPVMTDDYRFIFALYKNDFVEIAKSSGEILEGYFQGINRNTNSLTILEHDGATVTGSIGLRNLKMFRKYAVDVLGTKHLISSEKRCGVENRSNKLARKAKGAGSSAHN